MQNTKDIQTLKVPTAALSTLHKLSTQTDLAVFVGCTFQVHGQGLGQEWTVPVCFSTLCSKLSQTHPAVAPAAISSELGT